MVVSLSMPRLFVAGHHLGVPPWQGAIYGHVSGGFSIARLAYQRVYDPITNDFAFWEGMTYTLPAKVHLINDGRSQFWLRCIYIYIYENSSSISLTSLKKQKRCMPLGFGFMLCNNCVSLTITPNFGRNECNTDSVGA